VLGKRGNPRQYVCKSLISRDGAGNENRTRIASLEGWSFTIKLCPHEANGKKGAMQLPDRKPFFVG
jgi:hypothetical protein